MSQTNINIRMDEDLKNQFSNLCTDLGLTMTAAFSVFAKMSVRQQKIPFELSTADPFYSPANMERLARSIAAAKAGKLTYHEPIEADDEESVD